MADNFGSDARTLESPPTKLATVVPSDAVDLGIATRAINVEVSGKVYVTTVDGDDGDISVTAGIAFPIRVRRIWATGTTATGIRALS